MRNFEICYITQSIDVIKLSFVDTKSEWGFTGEGTSLDNFGYSGMILNE